MNRTQRSKSHMGKARVARARSRSSRRHHQLLMAELLEGVDTTSEVPVVHSAATKPSPTAAHATRVRIIEPGSQTREATPHASKPVASAAVLRAPAAASGSATALKPDHPKPEFSLAGLAKGFLLGAVLGAILVLLYLIVLG